MMIGMNFLLANASASSLGFAEEALIKRAAFRRLESAALTVCSAGGATVVPQSVVVQQSRSR